MNHEVKLEVSTVESRTECSIMIYRDDILIADDVIRRRLWETEESFLEKCKERARSLCQFAARRLDDQKAAEEFSQKVFESVKR